MKSKTSTIKCATCEFWTGNREPVFDASGTPKIDIIDTYGDCHNVIAVFAITEENRKQSANISQNGPSCFE